MTTTHNDKPPANLSQTTAHNDGRSVLLFSLPETHTYRTMHNAPTRCFTARHCSSQSCRNEKESEEKLENHRTVVYVVCARNTEKEVEERTCTVCEHHRLCAYHVCWFTRERDNVGRWRLRLHRPDPPTLDVVPISMLGSSPASSILYPLWLLHQEMSSLVAKE